MYVVFALGARAGVLMAALAGIPATGTEGLGLKQLECAKEKTYRALWGKRHTGVTVDLLVLVSLGWGPLWVLHVFGVLVALPALLCLGGTFWGGVSLHPEQWQPGGWDDAGKTELLPTLSVGLFSGFVLRCAPAASPELSQSCICSRVVVYYWLSSGHGG